MMFTESGGNVWPPSGPECERLVRCCEGRGFVQNGAAAPGPAGLLCLLAASVDCAMGLSGLEEQGVRCD